MSNQKYNKLAGTIQKELNLLLSLEISDPRLQQVTVTDVTLTSDLQDAKVYYKNYASISDTEVLQALTKAKGFLKKELAHRVKMRRVPDLLFRKDEALEYSERIEGILSSLKAKQQQEDHPQDEE